MEATPGRPAILEGLSSFLIAHEPHGDGFDVAHPAGVGGGRVGISCRGCGAMHEYVHGTLDFTSGGPRRPAPESPPARPVLQPVLPLPPDAPHPPPTSSERRMPSRPVAEPPTQPPRRSPRSMRGPGGEQRHHTTIALIAVALIALAVAGARLIASSGSKDPGGSGGGRAAGTPAGQATTAAPPPQAAPPPRAVPVPAPAPPAQPPKPAPVLISTGAYTIEAPPGWHRRSSSQGLLLAPVGSRAASLQVYTDGAGELPLGDLSASAAGLLERSIGSAPRPPTAATFKDHPAFRVRAASGDRSLAALGTSAGGTRYLFITDTDAGVSKKLRADLRRMLESVKLR